MDVGQFASRGAWDKAPITRYPNQRKLYTSNFLSSVLLGDLPFAIVVGGLPNWEGRWKRCWMKEREGLWREEEGMKGAYVAG